MQHLEVSGAVRPLKWSLGVKWLIPSSVLTAGVDSASNRNENQMYFLGGKGGL